MEISVGMIIGQLIVLLLLGLVIYFIALIPISLKRIAKELGEIKGELKKSNGCER